MRGRRDPHPQSSTAGFGLWPLARHFDAPWDDHTEKSEDAQISKTYSASELIMANCPILRAEEEVARQRRKDIYKGPEM